MTKKGPAVSIPFPPVNIKQTYNTLSLSHTQCTVPLLPATVPPVVTVLLTVSLLAVLLPVVVDTVILVPLGTSVEGALLSSVPSLLLSYNYAVFLF